MSIQSIIATNNGGQMQEDGDIIPITMDHMFYDVNDEGYSICLRSHLKYFFLLLLGIY